MKAICALVLGFQVGEVSEPKLVIWWAMRPSASATQMPGVPEREDEKASWLPSEVQAGAPLLLPPLKLTRRLRRNEYILTVKPVRRSRALKARRELSGETRGD